MRGRILQRTVGPGLQPKNDEWRCLREHIEEREWRGIDDAAGTERRDQRDGPRHHQRAEELVPVLRRQNRETRLKRRGHGRHASGGRRTPVWLVMRP
jgi:hypothetical protein